MTHSLRKVAWGCALAVLSAGAPSAQASPWKTLKAAALALAILGGGQPFLAGGAAPDPGADAPLGVSDPGCGERCESQYDEGLVRCEVYQGQMQPMRTLCLAELMAADEACMRLCEER